MADKLNSCSQCRAAIVLFIFIIHTGSCFISKSDPLEQFHTLTVVYPKYYSKSREKREITSAKNIKEDTLSVGFSAYDKDFILNLNLNKDLLPSHYFEKYQENGSYVIHRPLEEKNSTHCHYQGHIQGNNHSFVAVSICEGISGIIYDGKNLHYIQPDTRSKGGGHFLMRDADSKSQNFTCGVKDVKKKPFIEIVHEDLKRAKRSAVLHDPYKSNTQSRYIEMIIVNDNKEFKDYKSSKKAVFERSQQIANVVNALYQPLNIYVTLVGVIIWTENDEIKLAVDGDTTLTNFLHYRRVRLNTEHVNDNAQLITGITFDGGVVGKALKGVMCTYEYSGGVSMDHSGVVGVVATTVAHELGHNFGMEHDTEECTCPGEKCIMAPASSSSSQPKHWSSCSMEKLDQAYSQGLDYCLKNRPTDFFAGSCGNGFLDENEECDCGLKEFCDSKCCNATSCLLYSNATCATGACCDMDTCQVKKPATLCRDKSSECDLPEFCNGDSEFCPANHFLQNGEVCGNEKAYCFNGQCRSHADQCKVLWGKTGKVADNKCYQQNFKGNVNGNCGYNKITKTFAPCRRENVLCGTLHCTYLNEKLEFGLESAATLARSYITTNDETIICRSAIIDLGLSNPDPGMVPNGAKCGKGKVCLNQKCVAVSVMKNITCPYDCRGNGMCNSNGNCHCYKGYAAPYCDSPGPGGSIDSGPASDPNNYFVAIFMYIMFLGLLPLIILTSFAIYYYRSHLKNWWSKKAQKANIKSRTQTNAQRRAHPPTKFNFDRNSLRTLEISAPISPTAATTSLGNDPARQTHFPVRPAPPPPPPNSPPRRVTSFVAARPEVTSVARSSSMRSNRPPSAVFRPNCPPPRPPPPQEQIQENVYEDSAMTELYYDDCQTLVDKDTSQGSVFRNQKPGEVGNVKNSDFSAKAQKTGVGGTPKVLMSAPKTALGINKVLPNAPSAPNVGKIGTGAPKVVSNAPKTVTGASRVTSNASKTVTGVSKVMSNAPKTVTGASRVTSNAPKTVTSASRVTSSAPKTVTGAPKAVSNAPKTAGHTNVASLAQKFDGPISVKSNQRLTPNSSALHSNSLNSKPVSRNVGNPRV